MDDRLKEIGKKSGLRVVSVILLMMLGWLTIVSAQAQTLTGATLYHADENGSYTGREYWVTGDRSPGWHLYFHKENTWYNASHDALNVPLTPGLHTLHFYAADGGEFSHAGLSLFFDQEEKTPVFSVFAKVLQSPAEKSRIAVAKGQGLCTDHTTTPVSGTLRYERGDILVELVDFRLELPTIEKVDLVSPYNTQPDKKNDYVGTVTLRVTRRARDEADPTSPQGIIRYKSVTLTGHSGEVTSTEFSPDGQYLVACGSSEDRIARVWSTVSGRELFTFYEPPGIVAARFSPDSKNVLAILADNRARAWSVETGRVLYTLRGHTGPLSSMTYSPDGSQIATGSYDGTARIWDAKTGKELLVLKGHTGAVLSAAFSRDGKRLVTAGQDKVVKIWDLRLPRKPSIP